MPKTLPMIDMSAPVCCAPVAAGPMSDDDALHVALRLKALADPARVKIMSYLFSSSSGEENSGDLAAALGLTESTVSHHLTPAPPGRAGRVRTPWHERLPPTAPRRSRRAVCGLGPQLLHLALPNEGAPPRIILVSLTCSRAVTMSPQAVLTVAYIDSPFVLCSRVAQGRSFRNPLV